MAKALYATCARKRKPPALFDQLIYCLNRLGSAHVYLTEWEKGFPQYHPACPDYYGSDVGADGMLSGTVMGE
jgi:hypothetical protein